MYLPFKFLWHYKKIVKQPVRVILYTDIWLQFALVDTASQFWLYHKSIRMFIVVYN